MLSGSQTGGNQGAAATTTPATPANTATSATQLRITPLAGPSNWKMWKICVEDWMFENDLWDYVTGTKQRLLLGTTADVVKEWEKNDRTALGTIRRSVTDDVLVNIHTVETSKDAWDRLCQLYDISDMVRHQQNPCELHWAM
ncbi:hypothetical protein FS749_008158 [Ceratobasidium sp. UAMH 11750]|nr:hypothetical protein FS749_008158 [Ceratobasidium sp. UAMH 11750]